MFPCFRGIVYGGRFGIAFYREIVFFPDRISEEHESKINGEEKELPGAEFLFLQ